MNGNYISLSNFISLDSLQKLQDEFSAHYHIGIILADTNLDPITEISNPFSTVLPESRGDTCFSDVFFHVENNFRYQQPYISEPLFSSYLTGKILRTIVPIEIHNRMVGAACFVKMHPKLTPIQLYGHLKLAASSSQPLLKYLLDSYPAVPDNNISHMMAEFCEIIRSLIDENLNDFNLDIVPEKNNGPEDDSSLVIFSDENGDIVHTTNTLSKLLGYTSREAIKGKSLSHFLAFNSPEQETFTDVLEIDPQKIHNVILKHNDGKRFYGNLQVSRFKTADPDSPPIFYQLKIELVENSEQIDLNSNNNNNIFAEFQTIEDSKTPGDVVSSLELNLAGSGKNTNNDIAVNSLTGFASILNAYPKPLLVVDHSDHLCLWNNRAEQLFHFSKLTSDELLFSDFIKKESKSAWQNSLKSFKNSKKSESALNYYAKCLDGEGNDLSLKFDLYKSILGGVEYITITIREIKETIPGAEYLLAHQQSSNAGIVTTASNGDILSANSEALELFGTTTVYTDMGNFSDLFDSQGRHDINNVMLKFLRKNSSELTAHLEHDFDKENPLNLRAQKLHTPDNSDFNILWILSSFQIDGNGGREGEHIQKSLPPGVTDDLYKTLSELFANMSSKLFKDLYVLEDQVYLEPDQEVRFARIKQIAGRASELGEMFVYFSKKNSPNIENHDFNLLLETYYSAVKTQFKIPVKLIFDDIPQISADEGDFWFILNALLKNAEEACDENGKITISTFTRTAGMENPIFKHQVEGRLFVACRISDNGHGIPPEIKKKLFSLFSTDKSDDLGRGLGLACVKAIVERYDGFIDVESRPEVGTKITLYFPALENANIPPEPQLDPLKPTILALDDDPMLLDLYVSGLEKEGFNVLCASTGLEAINLMEEHKDKIALAIVDISLPDSDVIKCPMALGEIKPDIYYIIATGHENDGSFDEANKRLKVLWLVKPFKEHVIVGHVKRLVYPY